MAPRFSPLVRPQDLLSWAQADLKFALVEGKLYLQEVHHTRRGPGRGGESPGETEQLLLQSLQGGHELLDPRGAGPEELIRKTFFYHNRVGFPKDERLQFQPPDSRQPELHRGLPPIREVHLQIRYLDCRQLRDISVAQVQEEASIYT